MFIEAKYVPMNTYGNEIRVGDGREWQRGRKKQGEGDLSRRLLPHGLQHVLHLLPLLLGEVVRADPLLQELQATLLLTDPGTNRI